MDAAISKGRALPKWYLDEPYVFPAQQFFLKAFWDLNTCRSTGMGIGPIPWDKIVQYGSYAGLDDDMIEPLVSIIREMDAEYLLWHSDATEKRTGQQDKGPSRK